MQPEIIIGDYQQLKTECNLIRYRVFVIEQNVPETLELDDRDSICIHLLLKLNNYYISTGRIDLQQQGKIGRLAVLPSFRNKGYGQIILHNLELVARENQLNSVWLNAQKQSLNFYLKSGYNTISDEFLEANIPHLKMIKYFSD
ncbi:GNAT family N-acetyltransferase [Cyanobacterium aponinum AL20118]|uniref:GNAT family N-acetyltransferase n=1 Tax=Cyanobacterium aponinum AL20115 TaxID=3090662 RepID=A0AAF1C6H2_9CHRO|nr:GNAT family N-acetyltransferase [Cyanobacterium aponinum]WPF90280.1 GNAT family N-acetyltransferase [Cyanobacterium aponinum AL20115]